MFVKRNVWAAFAGLLVVWTAGAETREIGFLPDEAWWGGGTVFGQSMPWNASTNRFSADLRKTNYGNQTAPFLVSSAGRYVWSDRAFAFAVAEGRLSLTGAAPILVEHPAKDLRGAFLAASKRHFPPSGKTPDLSFVAQPQWNTWVELTYDQNEKDILAYAKAVTDHGFKPGVLMIDDTWQYHYGIWEFDPRRFRDPKGMIAKLHADGWKVMLWVCPYVSMDSPGYREMLWGVDNYGRKLEQGGLVMSSKTEPAVADWWNGKSAVVDLTHPNGAKWFAAQLGRLQREFGVDGFKLDAGDVGSYRPEWLSHASASPCDHCESYAKIGLRFPFNEYRACWKMQGQPLVQRLCDKDHSWPSVQRLVPDMIACGLLGHPFVCPDMIGSGSWLAFSPSAPEPYSPELFVRSAQVHALSPMMQFSAAPWRMLKGEHYAAVVKAVRTRERFAARFVQLAKECAASGEPMLRNLEYAYPHRGYAAIRDEFLMGDFLLVAPQIAAGARERKVVLPPGQWRGDDGVVYEGPISLTVATPLDRLPHFEKLQF